jgi:multidrug resistance efflux pump
MDFIGLASALADLGGYALFVLAVAVAAVGLYRQWWVPGWIWRAEHDARVTSEAEVRKQAVTLRRLTAQLSRERRSRSTDRRG